MKKILIVVVLVLGVQFSARAQENNYVKFYVSVGLNYWDNFTINSVLDRNDIAPVSQVMPRLAIGELAHFHKFSFKVEVAASFWNRRHAETHYGLSSASVNLQGLYNVLNIGKQSLYAGVVLDYQMSNLTLYSRGNTINFNQSLKPTDNSGLMMFYNHDFLLGPILSTGDLFPASDFSMRVALSYEFNLIHGRWKSDYAEVLNAPKEKAGRFTLSLLFPIFSDANN